VDRAAGCPACGKMAKGIINQKGRIAISAAGWTACGTIPFGGPE